MEKDENPPPQERETPASEEPTQIVMGVHLADEPNRDLVSFANKHDDPQKSVSFADPRILHNSSPAKRTARLIVPPQQSLEL